MARIIEQKRRGKRRGNPDKTKNVILFGFEGENKTEKKYFQNFQGRNKSYNIDFAYGNDTDPVQIVNNLINYMKEKDISVKHGDKIYCVFDSDVDKSKQEKINQAYLKASKRGIEIVMSVPSFEIWYLLHNRYTSHYFYSNDELIRELKKFISTYEKNINVFTLINKNVEKASVNAKALKKYHNIPEGQVITNMNCNPSTDVFKIVEYLNNSKENKE